MPASRLTIYNEAALALGEETLSALNEQRVFRRKCDAAWDNTNFIQFVLEAGQWQFATRTQAITYSPSVEPAFGYRRAFQRPDDFVRTTKVCMDEYLMIPLIAYQSQGGLWFADQETLYVSYVSNDGAYGLDLSLWPAHFTTFAAMHLACLVRQSMEQSNIQLSELETKRDIALKQALSKDAMESPTRFPPDGSWVLARSSRGGWRRDTKGY